MLQSRFYSTKPGGGAIPEKRFSAILFLMRIGLWSKDKVSAPLAE
jgi:hypothetical protein